MLGLGFAEEQLFELAQSVLGVLDGVADGAGVGEDFLRI